MPAGCIGFGSEHVENGEQSFGPMLSRLRRYLNNQFERDAFVSAQLSRIRAGAALLDAGAGSQRYRSQCGHLKYYAQDFAEFEVADKPGFADVRESNERYAYGPLDFVGDVWRINAEDGKFNAILCTEVLEHIPYPVDAIREFSRLLRPGGVLILTAPSNCLRHMDPFFFYSGFSDRFFERILSENGFSIEIISPVGDYYKWMCVELARTASAHSIFAKFALLPGFIYYLCKRPTEFSINTMCMGYHIVAKRL